MTSTPLHAAALALTLALVAPEARAAGLSIDPQAPPLALGGDRYEIGGHAWDVLPRVIFNVERGVAAPAGARPLGGRSYAMPVASAAAAVQLAVAWSTRPGLSAVFPDVRLERTPASADWDDPDYGGQWYLELLGIDDLHARSLGDPAVRVAVIDSGIDIGHPDLAPAVRAPYDAYSDDGDPSPDPGAFCAGASTAICDGHGTAVSGVVLARAGNAVGIVGLCPTCTLVPIKLLGDGSGAMSADIAAFEHAIAEDVGVINNSWGYTRAVPAPAPLAAVIERAATEPRGGKGALVVFAAGNDDRALNDDELTGLPGVVCVSATDRYGNPTNYTNRGASVDLAAPSATVTIAPDGGSTETFGGTSAAAPVVSGVAAWALSVAPELSAAELSELLISTARPNVLVTRDSAGHHDVFGYGELDPGALLSALEGGAPADTAEPDAGGADGAGSGAQSGSKNSPGCAAGPLPVGSFALWPALLWVRGRRRGGPPRHSGS